MAGNMDTQRGSGGINSNQQPVEYPDVGEVEAQRGEVNDGVIAAAAAAAGDANDDQPPVANANDPPALAIEGAVGDDQPPVAYANEAPALANEGQEEEMAEEAPPPPGEVLRPLHEDPMWLSDEEWELAMDLKAAIAADEDDTEPISDFLLVQFAIFALARDMHAEPPTVASLLDQVKQLQAVREMHGIADNYEQACQSVEWMIGNLPGYVLSYANYSGDESCCVVVNLAKSDRGVFGNGEKFSKWLAGVYYMQHACTNSFYVIRKGLNFMVECEGYEWRGQELARWSDMGSAYPLVFASFKHYHTGMLMNLVVTIARRLLPSYIHKHFEVGCQYDGNLSDVLLVPNERIATERILLKLKEGLKKRYGSVDSFSLEDAW